jgi:hypothetical protein
VIRCLRGYLSQVRDAPDFEMHAVAKLGTAHRFAERMTITTASSWKKKTRNGACLRRYDVGVPETRATTFLSLVLETSL